MSKLDDVRPIFGRTDAGTTHDTGAEHTFRKPPQYGDTFTSGGIHRMVVAADERIGTVVETIPIGPALGSAAEACDRAKAAAARDGRPWLAIRSLSDASAFSIATEIPVGWNAIAEYTPDGREFGV